MKPTPPEVSAAPVQAPATAPVRYALVWSNAYVYTTPAASGSKARMSNYPDSEREARVGQVWPVEVLDDSGDVVKVRTLGGEDVGHCYRGPSLLNAFSVVLYVPPSALAAVVQAPVVSDFDDGTRAAVNAGVAVSKAAGLVVADGLRLPLPGSAKVGATYAYADRFDMRALRQQTRAPLTVNGSLVLDDALTSVPVLRTKPLGDGAVVTLVTGCLQADAHTEGAPALVPFHAMHVGDGATPAAPKSAKHFPIGTKLFFLDGRDAGRTVDAIAMSLLDKHGELLCFQRSLADYVPGEAPPEHHVLDLCVSAADAREKAQRRATWPLRTTAPLDSSH